MSIWLMDVVDDECAPDCRRLLKSILNGVITDCLHDVKQLLL